MQHCACSAHMVQHVHVSAIESSGYKSVAYMYMCVRLGGSKWKKDKKFYWWQLSKSWESYPRIFRGVHVRWWCSINFIFKFLCISNARHVATVLAIGRLTYCSTWLWQQITKLSNLIPILCVYSYMYNMVCYDMDVSVITYNYHIRSIRRRSRLVATLKWSPHLWKCWMKVAALE